MDEAEYDRNRNRRAGAEDRLHWIVGLIGTDVVDTNLDGVFESDDPVGVFVVGKYETGQSAAWAEDVWSGDGVFDTEAFVITFQAGSHEKPSRTEFVALPRPAAGLLCVLKLPPLLFSRHRHAALNNDHRSA